MAAELMRRLRDEIDAIDRELLDLLARRLERVARVGEVADGSSTAPYLGRPKKRIVRGRRGRPG